jgi:uncharacterized protein (TIGR02145 family)
MPQRTIFLLVALSIMSAAVSVSVAQNVNISGEVLDSAGAGISGAVVRLEMGGQTATTGPTGSFTLNGCTTNIRCQVKQSLIHNMSGRICNGLLCVNIAEKAVVEIATIDLNGKTLSKVQLTMDAGTHSIALPYRQAGIYLYRLKSGSNEFVLEDNSIGRVEQRTTVSVQGSSPYDALAKQVKASAVINDVIEVTKGVCDYLKYRMSITNPDTSGIVIILLPCADTIRAVDGILYHAVRIGSQVWTVENFRTTKYNNNTPIPLVTAGGSWSTLTTPGYCFFNNSTDTSFQSKWGAFYNWYAAHDSNIAPTSWRVPSDTDWTTLQSWLIANGYNYDGTTSGNNIGKSVAARTDWAYNMNTGTIGNKPSDNNSSGFSALPAGCRLYDGTFEGDAGGAWLWSGTSSYVSYSNGTFVPTAWDCELGNGGVDMQVDNRSYRQNGHSIRLIRNY